MISRALNSDNDLFLLDGQIARVQNSSEVLQSVRSRLLFYLGEHFLDNTVGMAWIQKVFVKPVNLALIESLIRREIITTNGVESIVSFSMDFDKSTRSLSVVFEARTIYDEIINDEVYINV